MSAMNRLRTALLTCWLVAVPALGSAATKPKTPTPAPGLSCDRECLHGMVSTVLFAFLKHDTSGLPVADTLRVTEDSVEKPLDKVGLTRSLTRLRGYRQDIIDERAGIAGAHVMIEETGAPTLLVVRLKVVGDKISELETVATHSKAEGQIFNIDGLDHPSEGMGKVPRLEQLPTREQAIRIALLYPAGLEASSFVKADTPFAEDAFRLENGNLMAGPGCTFAVGCQNIKTQPLNNPNRGKVDVRVVGVDERLGIAWLRMEWGTRGNQKLAVWEAFKIYDGQIHVVEAFMKTIPPGLGSGWSAAP